MKRSAWIVVLCSVTFAAGMLVGKGPKQRSKESTPSQPVLTDITLRKGKDSPIHLTVNQSRVNGSLSVSSRTTGEPWTVYLGDDTVLFANEVTP